jgi:hypothetical protein
VTFYLSNHHLPLRSPSTSTKADGINDFTMIVGGGDAGNNQHCFGTQLQEISSQARKILRVKDISQYIFIDVLNNG